MKTLWTILATLSLMGCSCLKPTHQPESPLTEFKGMHFGVQFDHPDTLTTIYNPHGTGNRVSVLSNGIFIGGLIIGAPYDMSIEHIIAEGKKYYEEKHHATDITYRLYQNTNKYTFHHFSAKTLRKETKYIIQRFVHLRKDIKPDSFIDSVSGSFTFEFIIPQKDFKKLNPEVLKIIDTFRINKIP